MLVGMDKENVLLVNNISSEPINTHILAFPGVLNNMKCNYAINY